MGKKLIKSRDEQVPVQNYNPGGLEKMKVE